MPVLLDRSIVGTVCLCLFFMIVGGAVGMLLLKWETFKFCPTLTLGQFVQVSMLLLIFLLANHVYAKAHDIRKKRIEILIDMVGGIIDQEGQAHSSFLKCATEEKVTPRRRRDLDSSLRNYSNALEEFEQVLRPYRNATLSTELEALKRNRSDYKKLTTETPYPVSIPGQRITDATKFHNKTRANLYNFQLQLTAVKLF